MKYIITMILFLSLAGAGAVYATTSISPGQTKR